MNAPLNSEFREKETENNDIYDIRTSIGSRNIRLNHLLKDKKININYAKCVLSDHYDEYEKKHVMNSNSICRHKELDSSYQGRNPYYPFGCTDGKVVNSKMAENMQFYARFGSSCGRAFNATKFIKKYPQYKNMAKYLPSFPHYDWVRI
jgi:hypothetical protein